nr:unnamed protein product [Digitaria exilis]
MILAPVATHPGSTTVHSGALLAASVSTRRPSPCRVAHRPRALLWPPGMRLPWKQTRIGLVAACVLMVLMAAQLLLLMATPAEAAGGLYANALRRRLL